MKGKKHVDQHYGLETSLRKLPNTGMNDATPSKLLAPTAELTQLILSISVSIIYFTRRLVQQFRQHFRQKKFCS